jgi:hypothetical protein
MKSFEHRSTGVAGECDTEPSGAIWEQAKAILASKAKAKAEREAKRAATPVPNWIAYKDILFVVGKNVDHNGNWLGGLLPKCKVCEGHLPPREHHECSGFVPKYVEHDEAWHERQEARREEIRASKPKAIPTCDECGAEMLTLEDGQWHEENCVTDETRILRHENRLHARYADHSAVNGDEDDVSGYEDEPEDDCCEGDDDGYDCD